MKFHVDPTFRINLERNPSFLLLVNLLQRVNQATEHIFPLYVELLATQKLLVFLRERILKISNSHTKYESPKRPQVFTQQQAENERDLSIVKDLINNLEQLRCQILNIAILQNSMQELEGRVNSLEDRVFSELQKNGGNSQ